MARSSLGWRAYLYLGLGSSHFYGGRTGVVLLMLWHYAAAAGLLVGAEINGVIERAAQGETESPLPDPDAA